MISVEGAFAELLLRLLIVHYVGHASAHSFLSLKSSQRPGSGHEGAGGRRSAATSGHGSLRGGRVERAEGRGEGGHRQLVCPFYRRRGRFCVILLVSRAKAELTIVTGEGGRRPIAAGNGIETNKL